MTALCSFDFNKMFDANVYSVTCYFLVESAQMLTEIPQISGAHMSPTPYTGDSVLDTLSACSWAACSSASPQSQKPSPVHHEHILALVTVIAPHPAPPLHSCSILSRNRLSASGGLHRACLTPSFLCSLVNLLLTSLPCAASHICNNCHGNFKTNISKMQAVYPQ